MPILCIIFALCLGLRWYIQGMSFAEVIKMKHKEDDYY
jgi:hypothetical protein